MLLQRHEIGEVRDVRQPDDGEVQRLDRFVGIQPFGERILVLDVHLQVGHDAQHRQMSLLFQHGKAGAQDLDIAPEFVDDEPLDAGAFVRLQQRYGAVQLGKNAAPVDVARQKHRCVHEPGEAHVHDVVGLQVDLGGAAGPLDDDDVHILGQAVVGGEDVRDERFFHLEVGGGGHLAPHLAVHDDLTSHIAAGLEEDGVHPDIRLDAGCLGLHHLRPAHFKPVAGDEAVQRHVLALEGGHAVAVLCKNAAERRAQQAFARAAHRALDHDAPGFAHENTSERVWSSRSFSAAVRTAVRYQLPSRPG